MHFPDRSGYDINFYGEFNRNHHCLAIDGGPSAVFAIKMFNYVLPQLGFKESEVVSVNKPGDSPHVPDNRLMKEFMKRHFQEARYTVL